MPRPTNAQVAYGTLTVVLFTLAVLLLTDARSGAGVAAVAAAGLMAGLLVALVVAAQSRKTATARAILAGRTPAASLSSLSSAAPLPGQRVRMRGGSAEARVSEHSLRR